jgi:hypothetical protein
MVSGFQPIVCVILIAYMILMYSRHPQTENEYSIKTIYEYGIISRYLPGAHIDIRFTKFTPAGVTGPRGPHARTNPKSMR